MIGFALTVFLGLLVAPSVHAAGVKVDYTPQERLVAKRGAVALWDYHFATDDGVPYIHPLSSSDGRLLTGFAPPDHVWHRGLWFSWKFINGVNYWEFRDRKTPIWDGRTETVGDEALERDPGRVAITTRLRYSHEERVLLSEKRRIEASHPGEDGSFTLDWRMTFTAAGDERVVLDRTPPNEASWGGYAGLSYRAPTNLGAHRVLNSEGLLGKDGHGKPARWMDFSSKGSDGAWAGVTIFDHLSNPRYPTPWYVYTDKMAYMGPAILFNEPLTLVPGESFTLRYRVLVHNGQVAANALNKQWEDYVEQTASESRSPNN